MNYTYHFATDESAAVEISDAKLAAEFESILEYERTDRRRTREREWILLRLAASGDFRTVYADQYFADGSSDNGYWITDSRLRRLWQVLEPQQRELLLRLCVDGNSLTEIAASEGVNVSSINKRFQRILKAVKRIGCFPECI